MSNILLFLTAEYPFGTGEAFIENEMDFLAQAFESIHVMPVLPLTHKNQRSLPEHARLKKMTPAHAWKFRVLTLFNLTFWKAFLLDTHRKNLKISTLQKFRVAWGVFTKSSEIAAQLQQLIKQHQWKPEQLTCYCYWLDESALALSLLKLKHPKLKILARAHRWDVYEEMHPIPYLPFRPFLGKQLNRIVCIADATVQYMQRQFPEIPPSKLSISCLGTKPLADIPKSGNADFPHLVSCAYVHPRKRIECIFETLKKIKTPVHWTHLGSGPGLPALMEAWDACKASYPHLRITWKGEMSNAAIREFYAQTQVDLFISLSASEGIPVSMMEAQSAGIPILSTLVGGVGEIVKDGINGWCVSADASLEQVAQLLEDILARPQAEYAEFRKQACKHWETQFHAERNYAAFVAMLKTL